MNLRDITDNCNLDELEIVNKIDEANYRVIDLADNELTNDHVYELSAMLETIKQIKIQAKLIDKLINQ